MRCVPAGAAATQRQDGVLLDWGGLEVPFSVARHQPHPRFPLDQWVFNTEAHPLPVQGSSAEEAVKHQYLGSAEMTHRLSGYRESQHLAEWVQVSRGNHEMLLQLVI